MQLIFYLSGVEENECEISLVCSFLKAVLILDNKIPKSKTKSTRLINDKRALYPRFIFDGFKKFCYWISNVRDSACSLVTSHCTNQMNVWLHVEQRAGPELEYH